MTTREGTWGADLDPATRRMIEATNAEDNEAFLAAFAEDAVVDDFGRRFEGKAEIASWNARENIGTHNRIEVTGAPGRRRRPLDHPRQRGRVQR